MISFCICLLPVVVVMLLHWLVAEIFSSVETDRSVPFEWEDLSRPLFSPTAFSYNAPTHHGKDGNASVINNKALIINFMYAKMFLYVHKAE